MNVASYDEAFDEAIYSSSRMMPPNRFNPCRRVEDHVQRLTNTLNEKDAQIAELQRQLGLKLRPELKPKPSYPPKQNKYGQYCKEAGDCQSGNCLLSTNRCVRKGGALIGEDCTVPTDCAGWVPGALSPVACNLVSQKCEKSAEPKPSIPPFPGLKPKPSFPPRGYPERPERPERPETKPLFPPKPKQLMPTEKDLEKDSDYVKRSDLLRKRQMEIRMMNKYKTLTRGR